MAGTQINSTGVTFPDATSQTTARTTSNTVTTFNGSSGAVTGVSSFAGQTGAVDPTVLGAIGSVMEVFVNTTSSSLPNTTIAGSNLYYASSLSSANVQFVTYYASSTNYSQIQVTGSGVYGYFCLTLFQDVRFGNVGVNAPRGASTLSGTWRLLTAVAARSFGYDSCANTSNSAYYRALAVRIS